MDTSSIDYAEAVFLPLRMKAQFGPAFWKQLSIQSTAACKLPNE